MSWKCDICDTFNDEGAVACYVCDQPRSEASIREGKIRAREERLKKISDSVYRNGYRTAKIMFIVGCSLSLVAVIVAIITRLVGEDDGALIASCSEVAVRVIQKITLSLPNNLGVVFCESAESSFAEFGSNSQRAISEGVLAFSTFASAFKAVVCDKALYSVENACSNGLYFLTSVLGEKLSELSFVASELCDRMVESFKSTYSVFKCVVGNVKGYFD